MLKRLMLFIGISCFALSEEEYLIIEDMNIIGFIIGGLSFNTITNKKREEILDRLKYNRNMVFNDGKKVYVYVKLNPKMRYLCLDKYKMFVVFDDKYVAFLKSKHYWYWNQIIFSYASIQINNDTLNEKLKFWIQAYYKEEIKKDSKFEEKLTEFFPEHLINHINNEGFFQQQQQEMFEEEIIKIKEKCNLKYLRENLGY